MTNIIFKREPVIRESLIGALCLPASAFCGANVVTRTCGKPQICSSLIWICHETFRWRGAPMSHWHKRQRPFGPKASNTPTHFTAAMRLLVVSRYWLHSLDRHLFFQLSHLSHLMSSCVILVKAVNVHNNRFYWSHALLRFVRTISSLWVPRIQSMPKERTKETPNDRSIFRVDRYLADYGSIMINNGSIWMDRQINRKKKRERERSMGASLDGWTGGLAKLLRFAACNFKNWSKSRKIDSFCSVQL